MQCDVVWVVAWIVCDCLVCLCVMCIMVWATEVGEAGIKPPGCGLRCWGPRDGRLVGLL